MADAVCVCDFDPSSTGGICDVCGLPDPTLTDTPRCSKDRPCEVYNPLHSVLYGECYHLSGSDETGMP